MRYYRIVIDGGTEYTSLGAFGGTNPGALNVELDIPVAPFATPMGNAFVRIWGISIEEIAQAKDLNNKGVAVYGGMAKGLPLANPAQAGLLAKGYIQQAFGNWVGTEMTLDLIIAAGDGPNGMGTNAEPRNLTMNWRKGQPMSTGLKNALQTAFPGFTINMRISPKLVSQIDQIGPYSTLGQLSLYARDLSKTLIPDPKYPGVQIAVADKTIDVYDNTEQNDGPIEIDFKDLIGQPTWIESPNIQVKCVMRADLKVGQPIKLPPTLATTTAASLSQFRNNSIFQGQFFIGSMRHIGVSRQPDAASWVTVFDAYPENVG